MEWTSLPWKIPALLVTRMRPGPQDRQAGAPSSQRNAGEEFSSVTGEEGPRRRIGPLTAEKAEYNRRRPGKKERAPLFAFHASFQPWYRLTNCWLQVRPSQDHPAELEVLESERLPLEGLGGGGQGLPHGVRLLAWAHLLGAGTQEYQHPFSPCR